jgi:hypothetical protein
MKIEELEDHAFYESGLSADGCLEKLDDYTRKAIKRYGEILINQLINHPEFNKEKFLETNPQLTEVVEKAIKNKKPKEIEKIYEQ